MFGWLSFFRKNKSLKPGEWGRCVDDRDWNSPDTDIKLVYGKNYKILNAIKCPCCNKPSYDIGAKFLNKTSFTVCKFKHGVIPGQGIHWAHGFRFEKADEMSKDEIEEELQKAIEEEKYEKAQELHVKLEAYNK